MSHHASELLTAPRSRDLTTLAVVKQEILIGADTSNDAFLLQLIAEASSEVEARLGYPLYRAQVRETFAGAGGATLQLDRRPVRVLNEVKYQGAAQVLTGFDVLSPELGTLAAIGGWLETVRRDWSVTYTGGWLLPGDDVTDSTLTAISGDKSFNDPGGRFPLVLPGEWILLWTGWDAANQGMRKVVSRTANKIVVEENVTTEATAAVKTITFNTLPKNIERACLELVKIRFHGRDRDPSIKSQDVDGIQESFDVQAALDRVVVFLEPFVLEDPVLVVAKLPALFRVV